MDVGVVIFLYTIFQGFQNFGKEVFWKNKFKHIEELMKIQKSAKHVLPPWPACFTNGKVIFL